MNRIETILNNAKQIYESNFIYLHNEVSDIINKSKMLLKKATTFDNIKNIENKNNIVLPNELTKFFLISNGLEFNDFGGTRFYSIEEIDEWLSFKTMRSGLYKIAVFDQDAIIIDGKLINSSEYIFCGNEYCSINYRNLGCNFETFLYRMIFANGVKYWDWFPDKFNELHDFSQ